VEWPFFISAGHLQEANRAENALPAEVEEFLELGPFHHLAELVSFNKSMRAELNAP
jgi:hypothetical protein